MGDDLALAGGEAGLALLGVLMKTSWPRATMRTARTTSAAPQSLETKPDAPAARATAGEIRPAPEMRRTRRSGWTRRSSSATSAPDSPARKRSTSATCGLVRAPRRARPFRSWRRRSSRPSSGAREEGESPSGRRRGRRRRGCAWAQAPSCVSDGADEAEAPAPAVERPELDDTLVLQGFDGGEAQAEAGAWLGVAVDAVVGDLEGEACRPSRSPSIAIFVGSACLRGVAKSLGEDGLREGLEP